MHDATLPEGQLLSFPGQSQSFPLVIQCWVCVLQPLLPLFNSQQTHMSKVYTQLPTQDTRRATALSNVQRVPLHGLTVNSCCVVFAVVAKHTKMSTARAQCCTTALSYGSFDHVALHSHSRLGCQAVQTERQQASRPTCMQDPLMCKPISAR